MKIKYIKQALQDALEALKNVENGDLDLHLESNTYFVNGARFFLGCSGYDGGYLDLDYHKLSEMIEIAEDEASWDDEDIEEDE